MLIDFTKKLLLQFKQWHTTSKLQTWLVHQKIIAKVTNCLQVQAKYCETCPQLLFFFFFFNPMIILFR